MNTELKSMVGVSDTNMQARAAEALETARQKINRSYLNELDQYEVVPLPAKRLRLKPASDVRLYRLSRLVHENRQSILESLTAAYAALGASGYAVFLYLDSDGQKTDLYLGTRGQPAQLLGDSAGALLQEAFRGHFAGSELKQLQALDVGQALKDIVSAKTDAGSSVTAVTGVPSLSTEDVEGFAQGLERFLDAAERRSYRALILAEPLEPSRLNTIRAGYEQVATQLAPLQRVSWSYGDQDSYSVNNTFNRSIGETLGHSLGLTETLGTSKTVGISQTQTTGTNYSVTAGYAVGASVGVGASMSTTYSIDASVGTSTSDSNGTSENVSESAGESTSNTTSRNVSETVTDGRSDTRTQGSSRQLSVEFNDKGIEQLLLRIDHHLARVDEARTYGGWSASAYFISDSVASSRALSSIFLGLIRGKGSSQEDFALTTWRDERKDRVLEWLGELAHPILHRYTSVDPQGHVTTPATLLSGREVALQLSLPRRSTSTVSVVETRAFGRQIQYVDGNAPTTPSARSLCLGRIRHLWENLQQVMHLDLEQLSRHIFICGSTGSGKSNSIYHVLQQAHVAGIPFLVVEPAKGEYKHVVGHWHGVRVLGTHPKQAELLRINPFSFPDGIHVLEHVDRMIEIFNVCWPMYAAMPAVLKEAILQAYTYCGWDMDESCNTLQPRLFPGFGDLREALQRVIADSDYSAEAKSNYLGALGTRVKSLCNGLNERLFGEDGLSDAELFDTSVIIDLSRVGSAETRALVMGMLVMRLGEYRMATGGMNRLLQHLTVLEEAHNILPRQASRGAEGASIAGKSVEMLSSAIAEMRTYGEGFIIADQSPNAVDISAIRNTNIKIVLRLPEENDRRLIGGSIGLDEGQIGEIARLPCGAAIVHQNDWLEPVLCQIDQYDGEEIPYVPTLVTKVRVDLLQWRTHLMNLLLRHRLRRAPRVDIGLLKEGLAEARLPSHVRLALNQALTARLTGGPVPGDRAEEFEVLASLVVDALQCRSEIRVAAKGEFDTADIRLRLHRLIDARTIDLAEDTRLAVEQCMVRDLVTQDPAKMALYTEWNHTLTDGIV